MLLLRDKRCEGFHISRNPGTGRFKVSELDLLFFKTAAGGRHYVLGFLLGKWHGISKLHDPRRNLPLWLARLVYGPGVERFLDMWGVLS